MFPGKTPTHRISTLSASKRFYSLKMPPGLCLFIRWAFHSDDSHDGLKKPWFMCKNSLHPVLTHAVGLRPLSLLSRFSVFHPFCSGRWCLHSAPPLFSITSCHSPWERSIVSHRIGPQDNWCFLVLSLKFLVLSDSRSHLWRIWISSKTVKSRNPFYHCSWNSTYFSYKGGCEMLCPLLWTFLP